MRLSPRVRSAALPAAWFTALALLVAGPLLALSGYLLLLDWPSGPEFPRFSWFPLPSSGDVGNTTPLLAGERLLRSVHVYLPDKAMLVLPIIVGSWGVYRLCRRRLEVGLPSALFAGTLYVINPFVLDRYLAGHLHFLLGYALLPWGVTILWRAIGDPSAKSLVLTASWLFLLGVIDVHIAGMYALIVVLGAVATAGSIGRKFLFGFGVLLLAAIFSSFWLLPALLYSPAPTVGPADLEVYASMPRGPAVLPTLMAMYGFWRDEFVGAAQRLPALYFLFAIILGVAILGGAVLLRRKERRREAGLLGLAGGIGLLLAAGISFPPTAGVFRWLFEYVPFFGIYREPQKWLAILILVYALFGSVGVTVLAARIRRLPFRHAMQVAFIGASLAYGWSMLWGFSGQVALSSYPLDWDRSDSTMQGEGRLLTFPWNLYAVWSFSDGRIVANPAQSFFSREVLAANEAGFQSVPTQSTDPFTVYVDSLLKHGTEIRWLGHLVAPLGVRYVAWMHEVDHWQYRFLARQRDLLPIYRGERLSLFVNSAWRSGVLGLARGDPSSVSELVESGSEQRAIERLALGSPSVPSAPTDFPSVARVLPNWRVLQSSRAAFLLPDSRCTDGWLLGQVQAECHLAAVAAFEAPAKPEVQWRPLAGARLLGFAVTTSALLGTFLYLRGLRSPEGDRRVSDAVCSRSAYRLGAGRRWPASR